jgi:hypothetical protein
MAEAKLCEVTSCGNGRRGSRFCIRHLRRFQRYGDPEAGKPSPKQVGPCEVPGCESPRYSANHCRNHHHRFRVHGSPTAGPTANGEPLRWLEAHRHWVGDGCLIWPFTRRSGEYGRYRCEGGRQEYAHRRMCELVNGPPPAGCSEAAHSCGLGHEACVTPAHLRWATTKSNAADRTLHGTENVGERNGSAKLNAQQVRIIRSLVGQESQRATAKRFDISRQTVGEIQSRRRWKHLE